MKKHLLTLLLMIPAVLSAQVLDNWILDEPTGADLTVVQEETTVNEGLYAAKVSLLTTEVPYIYSKEFDVTEGSSYTFSIDIFDNTDQGSLKVYCEFKDASGEDIFGEEPLWTSDSDAWQTISWSATVPTGAVKAYVWIKCYDDAGFTAPVDFYLDNASFVMDGGDNLVPNGDFESWSNFYETFMLDFEDGTIPEDWVVINANAGVNDNGKDGQRTWVIGEGFGLDGGNSIFNDTYEADNENPADDWFVSPLVKITNDYVLSFWADADADYPDSLIVWVSKTGQESADFDILIDRIQVVGAYQKFSYVLSENENISEGDLVYIGFHNNTLGSFIDLDNIRYGELQLPQISRAWTVDETSMAVLYDSPLSAGLNVADYQLSGTADITFFNVEIDADNSNQANLTGANMNMTSDMTVDMITDNATGSSFEFYAGVSPISFANVANSSGYLSRDYPATFQGIVMAKDAFGDRVWLQDGVDPMSGVNTYTGDVYENVETGDEILISSINDPYENQTELYQPTLIATFSTGNDLYAPVSISGSDIDTSVSADTDPAEQYESMLVALDNVKIMTYLEGDPESQSDNYYIGTDDANEHVFRIGNRLGVYPDEFNDQLLVIGDIYNVTGIVVGRNGDWSVMPRTSADFEFVSSGVGIDNNTALRMKVFPNPVNDMLKIESNRKIETVRIYNISGVLVKEVNANINKLNVDLNAFNAGSYILKVNTDDGKTTVRRVMKK